MTSMTLVSSEPACDVGSGKSSAIVDATDCHQLKTNA